MTRFRHALVLNGLFTLLALVACGTPAVPESAQAPPTSVVAATTAALAAPEPTTAPTATPQPTLEPSMAPPAETAEASATTSAGFPLSVTDGLGWEVTIAAVPGRIVSLAPSNTEILFAVGAGAEVVGVTKYCNYPAEAQSREQIGGFSAKTISIEKIVALKPDLVVAGDESHQPVIDALVELGIPVVALKAGTFEDVYRNIELVGQVTGHDEQAREVVKDMRQRVDAVVANVAGIPQAERPRVFWEVFDEPLMTAGPSTFIGQMIDLAGGVNVFADLAEEYPEISVEEVVRRNPAVIMGPNSHGDKLTPELIAQRPGWAGIAAAQAGRIVLIDGDIASRPGPRLPEALESIAAGLHPEVFK